MEVSLTVLFGLMSAALLAGMIDAVVGGGGLIQIPALFAALPGQVPATLFGTNKGASIVGTASAAWRYSRRVRLPWRTVLPALMLAFAMSFAGAAAVAWIRVELLRPLMLVLMIAVAVYIFRRPDFGSEHAPPVQDWRQMLLAGGMGGAIGFYDGFFGPGTGSFLIFLFIRGFGFDFLHASASAKWVNVATNLAALSYFVPQGHWLPVVALIMATCNLTGAQIGVWLALRHGNGFVRRLFLISVSLLIARFAWETFA